MRTYLKIHLPFIAAALMFGACDEDGEENKAVTKAEVISNYADIVYLSYKDSYDKAVLLQTAINSFTDSPTEDGLTAAKTAWLASRDPYGQTEAYRFYDGPIDNATDGPEGQLNAWPMDEKYVDYVQGDANSGIINNTSLVINETAIKGWNEGAGGDVTSIGAGFDAEKAIASGYHAIEFLLWGQDLSATGPGARPYTDYTTKSNADRRKEYLKLTTNILVADLKSMMDAWDADTSTNYRNATWLKLDENTALTNMLKSIGMLAKGELGGERIDTALTNKSQEDEHSCFSDNTNKDVWANAKGVQNVYLGTYGDKTGASLSNLVAAANATLDTQIKTELEEAVAAADALPLTFDQFITDSNSEGYKAAEALVVKLQTIGNNLVKGADALGLGTISIELPE